MGYGLSIGNIRLREFSHSLYTSIHEARLSKTRSGDKSKRVVFSPFKISRFTIHDSCPDKRQFYDASYKTKACAFLLN